MGELSAMAGEPVNWNSQPQVLKLLQSLGADVADTKSQTLEAHRGEHPVIPLLLEYRGVSKRASTYGQSWIEHVHPVTGRIHADWQQLGAESGRMACRKPNLQNIPRDGEYRDCFPAQPVIWTSYGVT